MSFRGNCVSDILVFILCNLEKMFLQNNQKIAVFVMKYELRPISKIRDASLEKNLKKICMFQKKVMKMVTHIFCETRLTIVSNTWLE